MNEAHSASVCSASVPESTSDELLPPSLLATTEARRTLCARFPGKAVACAVAGGRFLALASPRAWAVDDVARWEAWCAAFLTTSRTTRPLGVTCAEASDAFGASLWSLLRFWFARWMLYLRVVESSRQPRSHGPPAQPLGPTHQVARLPNMTYRMRHPRHHPRPCQPALEYSGCGCSTWQRGHSLSLTTLPDASGCFLWPCSPPLRSLRPSFGAPSGQVVFLCPATPHAPQRCLIPGGGGILEG